MKKYISFETERLILKPTSQDDATFILELVNTPKWLKNIGDRNVKNLDDARKYIRNRITKQFEELGYSNYTVIRKSDGAKLGSCGLYNRDGVEGIDLGFAFLPDFEGQGYAFESASKLKEAALNQFELKQLSAITIKENLSSQKLLEKLRFKFSKIIKMSNDKTELLLYELTLT